MNIKFEIKSRWTAAVLFSVETESLKLAVEAAVNEHADLRGANLRDADLRGANLRDADLRGADLGGANLRDADLGGADLGGANLRGANLRDANLRDADLRGANLRGADLGGANLRDANLRDADLRGANLRGANLRDANLRDADLRGANLRDADLGGANLRGANLRDADLRGANLRDAKNIADAKNLRLPTGETWGEYLAETVPALLAAGGKPLESFKEHWDCHDWDNCPMAHAFDCKDIAGVPILFRPRAEQFVQFFDARQIPATVLDPKQPVDVAAE